MSSVNKEISEETDNMIDTSSKEENNQENNQDFNQKLNVGITLVLELYRVLMGAFLVAFIPQLCGDDICSLSENISRDDSMSQIAVTCNAITMASFLALYFIEVKRETKMINYLEVNRFNSCDNEAVGEALEKLSVSKKQSLWDYDGYYRKAGYVSMISFVINAIVSSIVVYDHYLDSKTLTVFLTNLLFMGSKVGDVFSTVNTKKNVFYSAYLKDKVQYNDVDPDKIISSDIIIDQENPALDMLVNIEDGNTDRHVKEPETVKEPEPVKEPETVKEPEPEPEPVPVKEPEPVKESKMGNELETVKADNPVNNIQPIVEESKEADPTNGIVTEVSLEPPSASGTGDNNEV